MEIPHGVEALETWEFVAKAHNWQTPSGLPSHMDQYENLRTNFLYKGVQFFAIFVFKMKIKS